MSFLPVVQRELAVGARRPATYRTRMIAVALATLLGVFGLWIAKAGQSPTSGGGLLLMFAPLLLLFCLLEGARSTADCLSEEKRAGTLGLLFLTDLTGLDVVLGKLFATSLRASFAMLGVLPVAAMTLPLGGVSGPELARLALALGGALWVSLALGLAVSAISRDEGRALWGTLAGLAIACAGPLVAASVANQISSPSRLDRIAALSPVTAYLTWSDAEYAANPAAFWISLVASGLGGMGLVGFAAWAAPRFWGNEPYVSRPSQRAVSRRRFPMSGELNGQPGAWLALRHWEPGRRKRLAWALAVVGGVGIVTASSPDPDGILVLPFLALLPFKVALTLGTCQFFARLREDGLLDSLRAAPAGSRTWPDQFAAGAHRAWKTPFGLLFGGLLVCASVTSVSHSGASEALVVFAYALGTEAMDLLALYWTGEWLALRSGRATAAAMRALVWVHLLPSLLCCGLRLIVDLVVWFVMRERLRAVWSSPGLDPATASILPAAASGIPPRVAP